MIRRGNRAVHALTAPAGYVLLIGATSMTSQRSSVLVNVTRKASTARLGGWPGAC